MFGAVDKPVSRARLEIEAQVTCFLITHQLDGNHGAEDTLIQHPSILGASSYESSIFSIHLLSADHGVPFHLSHECWGHQGGIHKPPPRPQSCYQCQISTMISSASAAGDSPAQKGVGGNISSIFDDKTRARAYPRFSELKKTIWKDSMRQTWTQVLAALKERTEQIESLGSKAGNMIAERLVCAQLWCHRRSQGFTTMNYRKGCQMEKSQR